MKNLILNRIAIILIPICITAIIGCSSGQTISEDDEKENESLFVQRDFGAKVFILMRNSKEYSGELLTVRDSTMLLCKVYEASEEDLSNLVYPFYSLNNHDVQMIELRGGNQALLGIIFGGLTGATVGFGISKTNRDWGTGLCIAGIIGPLLGGIIGYNITDDEVVYEYANSKEYDFNQLNIYSRYGGKEPDYLKEIK